MLGIVLVTHGRLAEEFIAAAEHVVGKQTHMAAICIAPDDDMEARRKDILTAIQSVNKGSGVAVLTDMFGGTPSNLAIAAMQDDQVDVVAGVNLPMLIKLLQVREEATLEAAVTAAQEAGRKYINVAGKLLPQNHEAKQGQTA